MHPRFKNYLIIFCGPSGAGKTTVANMIANELNKSGPTIHVQTDIIRRMIVNPTHERGENRFVYSVLYYVAKRLLPQGYNVILDGTFLKEDHRKRAIIVAEYYKINYLVIALKADLLTLIERNKGRPLEEYVPENVIARFWSRFQPPLNGIIIDTDLHSPKECVDIILNKLKFI
ncbi:MAG: ATP-binding protein [Nitrososphaeria archaeon]